MINLFKGRFMSHRKLYWLVALTILTVGVIVCILAGVNRAATLSSGSELVYSFEMVSLSDAVSGSDTVPAEDLLCETAKNTLGEDVYVSFSSENRQFSILSKKNSIIDFRSAEKFENEISLRFPGAKFKLMSAQSHDTDSSGSLLIQCIAAICIAFVMLTFYISIKYKKISFWAVCISCISSLLIDCMVGFFSIIFFNIPLDENIFAIIIAVMGCSVNAEITVFDSIRENNKFFGESVSYSDIANMSISESFRRIISTNICMIVSALIAVIVSAIYGEYYISSLCVPVIFSLITCTFTSLFIASSIWVSLLERSGTK